VNRTSRPHASTLPCLFATLSNKYSELKQCDIKSEPRYRQASGDKIKGRVKLFAKYFTEISSLIDSLKDYSICERHYNQIVNNDFLLEKLKSEDNYIPDFFLKKANEKNLRRLIIIQLFKKPWRNKIRIIFY
jgi:hypothetical protein